MGNDIPADLPRIHGKYRIKPVKEQPEKNGRRRIPAQPGLTYVLLWQGRVSKVLAINDNGKHHFVSAIPKEASLAHDEFLSHDGFNRDGAIPLHVCEFIKFALEIQSEHVPKGKPRKKKWHCPCESCQSQQKSAS